MVYNLEWAARRSSARQMCRAACRVQVWQSGNEVRHKTFSFHQQNRRFLGQLWDLCQGWTPFRRSLDQSRNPVQPVYDAFWGSVRGHDMGIESVACSEPAAGLTKLKCVDHRREGWHALSKRRLAARQGLSWTFPFGTECSGVNCPSRYHNALQKSFSAWGFSCSSEAAQAVSSRLKVYLKHWRQLTHPANGTVQLHMSASHPKCQPRQHYMMASDARETALELRNHWPRSPCRAAEDNSSHSGHQLEKGHIRRKDYGKPEGARGLGFELVPVAWGSSGDGLVPPRRAIWRLQDRRPSQRWRNGGGGKKKQINGIAVVHEPAIQPRGVPSAVFCWN